MAKFIELTLKGFTGKKPISVNLDQVQTAVPLDQGCRLRFEGGYELEVDERYQELIRKLFDAGTI